MARNASHDRQGSNAGRGFRYQDAAAAWLCVRVWAGIDPPSVIIPEGRDDVERRSAAGSTLVQIKSRREHLGDLPLADARDFIKAPWERHDKAAPAATALELVLERPPVDHAASADGVIGIGAKLAGMLPGGTRGRPYSRRRSRGTRPSRHRSGEGHTHKQTHAHEPAPVDPFEP